ncbi:MAG: FecR domain-containing protein [Flavobacteriaceae bacterium]|nr:FecR domain-containing protein [Flavobacteriaceae bacterium]
MEKKDLLNKWLNDELTPEEFEVFRTIPEFSSYQKIDAFVKEIELPVHNVEAGLEDLKLRNQIPSVKKDSKVISLSSVLKVAAILVLLLTSYYFISNYTINENTELAQTEIVTLPGNSIVVINEDSELSYKRFNWGNNRIVDLEGEAYFAVEKGSAFTVQTAQGTITVLGTKFNVSSKERDFIISCYEGLVRVDQGDLSIELPAGRAIALGRGDFELNDIHTTEPGWLYNESTFDDTPILAVLGVLKTEYGIQLTTENIDVNLRFTGGFPNDDLEAALQAITVPLHLNYSIENKDAVTIYGEGSSE